VIGIPVSEQILIYNGTPLDPRQTLGAYRLLVRPHISTFSWAIWILLEGASTTMC
jgi:hypothetical protein